MTLWYVALLAVIVAAVGTFLVLQLRADLTGRMDDGLRSASGQVVADYRAEGVVELADSSQTVLDGERAVSQVLEADGSVVARWGDPAGQRPMLVQADVAAVAGGRVITRGRSVGQDGQTFRLVGRPVTREGRRQVLVVGESLGPVERSVRRVVILLLLAGPAALLATALGGWWLARRALLPVHEMTRTAEAIGLDRLDERIPEPRTRDELAHLARTLNTMLDRIRGGVAEQRRLVADASHELRTPLAAMRAEIDVSLRADELPGAAREVLVSAREEVDRLSRTVDDLLTLATVDDAGLELRPRAAELDGIAREQVDALRPLAGRRGVTIEQDGAPVAVMVDPDRLGHAVRNIVENAIKFSPEGGIVRVRTERVNGSSRLVIEDEGPGVPEELRERIFDRFFRVDPSRTRETGGSGLGLAITREIVVAHGGLVRVEGRPSGSAFVVEVPSA
jgi:heavy metal sensor kinase